MQFRWIGAVAIAAVFAPGVRPADGCSFGLFPPKRTLTFPADGASDVATNLQVVLVYAGTPAAFAFDAADVPGIDPSRVVLRPKGGGAVPTTATVSMLPRLSWTAKWVVAVRPDEPLQPMTSYEIVDANMPCGGLPCPPDPQVVATFMTGAGPDTEPPLFAGLSTLTPGARYVCGSIDCCEPSNVRHVTLDWAPASEPALYRVEDIAGGTVRDLLAATTLETTIDCAGANLFGGSPGPYRVRAVDWAGNVEENDVQRRLEGACDLAPSTNTGPPPAPDAGPQPPWDAAPAHDGPAKAGGRGCEIGTRGAGASPPLVALLVVTAVFAVRRGRGRELNGSPDQPRHHPL